MDTICYEHEIAGKWYAIISCMTRLKTFTTVAELEKIIPLIIEYRIMHNPESCRKFLQAMVAESYRVTVLYEDEIWAAFAGYRHMTTLQSDKIIYVDDFYIVPGFRNKKHGFNLLKYLINEAKLDGYKAIYLDASNNTTELQDLYILLDFSSMDNCFSLAFDISL
jgi:GNAT superfamily N-acetyltransferase